MYIYTMYIYIYIYIRLSGYQVIYNTTWSTRIIYVRPRALKFNDICQGTLRCEHSSRGGVHRYVQVRTIIIIYYY